jgi:cytochrome c-type biogenesis protein CcmH/NrfG
LNRPVRVRNPRTARNATHRRIVRKSRARYANIKRVGGAILVLLVLFMGYVLLTSTLTGLSYAVARAAHQRESLVEETMRLDDRITALRSDDRLSAIAVRLKMSDPQQFAVVRLSRPAVVGKQRHLAVLSSLAGLFVPPAQSR